jgi:hypothetical protein
MPKGKIFYTDVDGVLLSIWRPFFKWLYEMTGSWYCEEDFTRWNTFEQFGLTDKEIKQAWELIWTQPAEIRYGAKEFIQELRKEGYWVVGVSHRTSGLAIDAAHRDFRQLGLDHYELTDKKGEYIKHMLVGNAYNKPAFFIDDKAENVLDVWAHCNELFPKMEYILFKRTHNTPNYDVKNRYIHTGDFGYILWRAKQWSA